MLEQKLKELSREELQEIILKMTEFLSEEQSERLRVLIENCQKIETKSEKSSAVPRMSQEFVDEKIESMKGWMRQIEEGELYLDTDEYEDYSAGYWDSEWIVDYYDNQGIGEKILSAIRFAKECVDDGKYKEANDIYEWLWEMSVSTDSEFDDELVDLEKLVEEKIVNTDIKQVALLTLYADYQVQEPEKRAEDIYLYFSRYSFLELHIEDMFHVGRENLTETERFWKDWIALLKTKSGSAEGRLLREAILYQEGTEGLVKMADENCDIHPSLYLAAMKEYEKKHDYAQIEKIGERALEKIDTRLIIRSETALKAAYASSCLMNTENVMRFCWEAFRSDTNDRNFLRLFGTKEMAERYGIRGKEILCDRAKEDIRDYAGSVELQENIIRGDMYNILNFYTGDFEKVKQASKNPKGSLGWSSRFIRYGIRLILLYLYEKPLPSKAAAGIAADVDFQDHTDFEQKMYFEKEIEEESRQYKVSEFWNYFQRWKGYFKMEQEEKESYLVWAEKIVYSRADAIVNGQHRRQYAEVAELLAMAAEVKESMGMQGEKRRIFVEYKNKFPRHSAFQKEMKYYFGNL